MSELPVERPIDAADPTLAEQRRDQLARYLRGEFVFPGQRFDTKTELEASLLSLERSLPYFPPRPLPDHDVLRRAQEQLGLTATEQGDR